ncbi:D-2-hydroxyglutarate dehydrogenase [Candidatus Rhodobacter oscarellae]|uniref:D-2-hydroxyglutarate dehydrogenase n=1 Tax=Candidatus Rhodobacter oscarellae TaxID=1675527 RepID=A0A0J9E1M8_9RHOB|nr:FAD-binding oxidoreductase [Candidatus Rhodobacter lobularis]KMW56801.1 D-2-hydroxyglutarate dehydrogenase [Candidatus Rhodobacter lobularis]
MLNDADAQFAEALRADLPQAAFREVAPRYLEEPRGAYRGQAGLVLAPGSTEEVATILRAAGRARVPVVPYGGGTGLVGGQVLPEGPAPLLLSLERMTAIRATYPSENVLVAEAGAILETVQGAAEQAGRLFPLTLASQGSARIGGLLSTNAGGVNVLRYGNARELCLGLEAVLPDGSIWHGLKRLRKDNTGYDLRNLLIGAEGTLGVITAAALRLYPLPAATGAALMVVPSPAAALELLAMAGDVIGEGISAFELISGQGLRFLAETVPELRQPFADPPDWMVLVDLGLGPGRAPQDALEALFARGHEAGLVSDGLIAQSEAQRRDFWHIRETIPEANKRVGAIASHDISLPLSAIPDYIARASERLAQHGAYRINCFGHLGDGNLHFNAFPLPGEAKADRIAEKPQVQRIVHDLVHEMDGSISAEHGIGRLKAPDLERYGDPSKLAAMRAIKSALDPNGIMNPGAVLRAGPG